MAIRANKITLSNFNSKFLLIVQKLTNVTEFDLSITMIKIHATSWKRIVAIDAWSRFQILQKLLVFLRHSHAKT